MTRSEAYSTHMADRPVMRGWFFIALICSLVLHGGLYYYFTEKKVDRFTFTEDVLANPEPMHLTQVSIPPVLEEPAEVRLKLPDSKTKDVPMTLAPEKPEAKEVRLTPNPSELVKPAFTEPPRAEISGRERMLKGDEADRREREADLKDATRKFLDESPLSPNQPRIHAGKRGKTGEGGAGNIDIPGLASIGDLLSKTGELAAGERAAMSGGTLFDYDQATLRGNAVDGLRQVGILFAKHPKAKFIIEGHTDSFGSPEYNQKLSERRAATVKTWLVQTMGIAPERIQTIGYGSSKLVVPAGGGIEEQEPNRRVEIVVKTNG